MDNNEMFVSLIRATIFMLIALHITSTIKEIILGAYESWEQRDERFKHEKEIKDLEFEGKDET